MLAPEAMEAMLAHPTVAKEVVVPDASTMEVNAGCIAARQDVDRIEAKYVGAYVCDIVAGGCCVVDVVGVGGGRPFASVVDQT